MRQVIFLVSILGVVIFSAKFARADGGDSFYCLDMSCHDVISVGKTLLVYSGRTNRHLSFKKNEDVSILSKPTDKTGSDWVGKIRNKIGLIPKDMMREDKMNKPVHPETYKYPLDFLPLWRDPPSYLEPEPKPDVEDEDDPVIEDTFVGDINSTAGEISPPHQEPEAQSNEKNDDPVREDSPDDINSTVLEVPEVRKNEQLSAEETIRDSDTVAKEIPEVPTTVVPLVEAAEINESDKQSESIQTTSNDQETQPPEPSKDIPTVNENSNIANSKQAVEKENNVEEESPDVSGKEESSAEEQEDESVKSTLTDWFGYSDGEEEDDEDDEDSEAESTDQKSGGEQISETTPTPIEVPASLPPTNVAGENSNSNEGSVGMNNIDHGHTHNQDSGHSNSVMNSPPNGDSNSNLREAAPSHPDPSSTSNEIDYNSASKDAADGINYTLLNPPEVEKIEEQPFHKPEAASEPYEVPTTSVPLVEEPPTVAQIVEAPSTAAPAVEEPITEAPIVASFSDETPLVSDQVTEAPSVPEPVTESPAVPDPIVVPPSVPEPVEEPSVSEPVEEPSVHKPVEEPSVPEPVEEPVSVQDPVTEAPLVEATTIPSVAADNNEIGKNTEKIQAGDNEPEKKPDIQFPESVNQETNKGENENVPKESPDVILEENSVEQAAPSTFGSWFGFGGGGQNADTDNKEPEADPVGIANAEESSTAPIFQAPEVPVVLPPVPEEKINTNEALRTNQEQDHRHIHSHNHDHSHSHDIGHGHSHNPFVDQSHSHSHNADHGHGHSHDHGHGHNHYSSSGSGSNETSSLIIVVKHLSSTLLSFLPEHLQDTILDVDDALVFTGIIALCLVSICVPYFFLQGFMSARPLKKKVVELNKSLWKVSTAYENQQEEFEIFKKKALEFDEDKKRVDQLEAELAIVKNLEAKQKEQVLNLKRELKSSAKVALEVENLVENTMELKTKAVEERDKLKTVVMSLQDALNRTSEQLEVAQAEASTYSIDLELARHANENFSSKISSVESEMAELKAKIKTEVSIRQQALEEGESLAEEKIKLQEELVDLKEILQKYEDTVSNLNQEIGQKENELMILKDSLGEDSPLVDIAETQAKLKYFEDESVALQSRVDSVTLEKNSISRNFEQITKKLEAIQAEKEHASNRLGVLEAWFKEKEEELRTAVAKYEAERNIRGKDKDDLVKMIEEKSDEVRDLTERIEALKDEFEDTKQQHRNEIRAMEAKSHENWLSLCQAERKAQDARKDAELLRQKLTAITKEKGGDESEVPTMNGDVPFYSLLPPELVPPPIPEITPSYFGLDDFLPPPPLPLDEEREPLRPPPLGRLSPTWNSDLEDNPLSPIRRRGRRDYSDGSSRSGSRSPPRGPPSSRGNWSDRDRPPHDFRRNDLPGSSSGHNHGHNNNLPHGPKTSSPIEFGANL